MVEAEPELPGLQPSPTTLSSPFSALSLSPHPSLRHA
jgi:hypothetical protein